jgi:hypothetical protein
MPAAAPMVMSVLDEVESGLVVLDKDFQAQFINRAFYQMWELPDRSTQKFRHLCARQKRALGASGLCG